MLPDFESATVKKVTSYEKKDFYDPGNDAGGDVQFEICLFQNRVTSPQADLKNLCEIGHTK